MTPTTSTLSDPLAVLPSVLAIPALRQQVLDHLGGRHPGRAVIGRLLALDPLTVLRCLRMAQSPVYGLTDRVRTLDDLLAALGHTVVSRAFAIPAAHRVPLGGLIELWTHALATAHAARNLARDTGTMDPEEAYLAGLLHDFDLWLHALARAGGLQSTASVRTWARHWRLTSRLQGMLEGVSLGRGQATPRPGATPESLLGAAELLAELADFWHPGDDEELSRSLLSSTVSREDLLAARELRREVKHHLHEVGLETMPLERTVPSRAVAEGPPFQRHPAGSIGDVTLNLLQCTKSPSYRGIITATTSAALRYLLFDRAWYVIWIPATGHCILRAKADLTPLRLHSEKITPTNEELTVLGRCFRTEQPEVLTSEHDDEPGLLHRLGVGRALIVALNCEFMSPTFLVLDRTLSGLPIGLPEDAEGASTLAGIASLLTENQLLQRRRRRAQRFALIDPLTQLANRGVGIHSLTREVFRAQRAGLPLTVMMLDLDNFKKLNDDHGHLHGDRALRATAEVLRRDLRRSDTVCRYGGEEFMAVLAETDLGDASVLATRLFTAIEERGQELDLPLTVSIGLAELLDATEPADSLLHRADRALYASKASGRNRFSVDA